MDLIILSLIVGLAIGFFIGQIVENSKWKWFLRKYYKDIADVIIGHKEYWYD